MSAAQQTALQPLAPIWTQISSNRKRKWIALSARFSKLSAAEQATLHGRMAEWATLSNIERNRARLNFTETRSLSSEEKKIHWDSYQALSPTQKQQLARQAANRAPLGAAPAVAARAKANWRQCLSHRSKPARPRPGHRPARSRTCSGASAATPDEAQAPPGRSTRANSAMRSMEEAYERRRAALQSTRNAQAWRMPDERRRAAPKGELRNAQHGGCLMNSGERHTAPTSETSAVRGSNATPATLVTPPLLRRMACWLYEGMLLFGVVFIAGYLFGTLSQTRNAMDNRHALQGFLFVVFGIYFTWFWARGQTLAMKTWDIAIVDRAGRAITQPRALLRYLASWAWILPPLAASAWYALPGGETAVLWIGWVAVWALLSRFHPQQQFWHDAIAGTRLVTRLRQPKR